MGADVFMTSIDVITSKEKTKMVNGHPMHFRIWNPTIANLTLMALGSSAPEILLSFLEVISEGMATGALGPVRCQLSIRAHRVARPPSLRSLPSPPGVPHPEMRVWALATAVDDCRVGRLQSDGHHGRVHRLARSGRHAHPQAAWCVRAGWG